MVDSRQHWADKEWPEPPLIQTATDQVGERLWRDLTFLTETVHVDFVAEEIGHSAYVGREAGEPEVAGWCVIEDFGEVVRDGEGLKTKAEVAGYGDAVFADHCHAGAAI